MADHPPLAPPTGPVPVFETHAGNRRKADLRKLALRQRWMIWLVLAAIVAQFVPLITWGQLDEVVFPLLALFHLAVYVLMIVGVALMLTARATHPAMIVLLGFLMLAPCANLVVLVVVNLMSTRALRRAGLRVGFMGVDPEEVERVLNPDLCTGCGYNLTGNVSGLCPECGRPVGTSSATPG